MHDGSRLFACLPESYCVERPQWERLREHVASLTGAEEVEFVTDEVTEAWLSLRYREHVFSLNSQIDDGPISSPSWSAKTQAGHPGSHVSSGLRAEQSRDLLMHRIARLDQ